MGFYIPIKPYAYRMTAFNDYFTYAILFNFISLFQCYFNFDFISLAQSPGRTHDMHIHYRSLFVRNEYFLTANFLG